MSLRREPSVDSFEDEKNLDRTETVQAGTRAIAVKDLRGSRRKGVMPTLDANKTTRRRSRGRDVGKNNGSEFDGSSGSDLLAESPLKRLK